MKRLLILGAGQYGKVAYEIARAMEQFDGIAFLDDNSETAVGKLSDYKKLKNDYDSAIVAIGNAGMRLGFIERLTESGYDIPVMIHPKAYVSPSAVIGKGSFIEPMAVVHTDVVIGIGAIVSAGTIINHNAVIGDGCHLDCGTVIKAREIIEDKTKTDCGQVI